MSSSGGVGINWHCVSLCQGILYNAERNVLDVIELTRKRPRNTFL